MHLTEDFLLTLFKYIFKIIHISSIYLYINSYLVVFDDIVFICLVYMQVQKVNFKCAHAHTIIKKYINTHLYGLLELSV